MTIPEYKFIPQIKGIKDPLISNDLEYDDLVDLVHSTVNSALRDRALIRKIEKAVASFYDYNPDDTVLRYHLEQQGITFDGKFRRVK